MKKIFLILAGLLSSSLLFAEDDMQNHLIFFNNQNNVNMLVFYSYCYSYNSIWFGKDLEYCTGNSTATLYAKNNPKGPRFSEIKWEKYPSSNYEYLKITKVTLFDLDESNRLDIVSTKHAFSAISGEIKPIHAAYIFSTKKRTLAINEGSF